MSNSLIISVNKSKPNSRPNTPPLPSHSPPSTSIFHVAKRLVLGSSTGDDTAFNALAHEFHQFNQQILGLRNHLLSYASQFKGVFANASAIASDFNDMMKDIARPHPYEKTLSQTYSIHSSMVSNSVSNSLVHEIDNTVIAQINEILESHARIDKTIAERNEARNDYLYYKKKVDSLQNADDRGKVERNDQKLKQVQEHFEAIDKQLHADMELIVHHRVATLGPLLEQFVVTERRVVYLYNKAVTDIKVDNVNGPTLTGTGEIHIPAPEPSSHVNDLFSDNAIFQ